jgi:cytidine deaminase
VTAGSEAAGGEGLAPAAGDQGPAPGAGDHVSIPAASDHGPGPAASDLLEVAATARSRAYAPYSGYAVGAALEAASGRVFSGANVENAAYGTSMCAERVALFKAVSEGERAFVRLAVVGEGPAPYPCGACRQALAEFASELEILVRGSGAIQRRRLDELLPAAFRLDPAEARGRGGPRS